MKKNLIVLLLLLCTLNLFSQNELSGKWFTTSDYDYYFKNDILEIDKYNPETKKLESNEYPYEYRFQGSLPYLILEGGSNVERYLALTGENILLLYSKDNSLPLYGGLFGKLMYVLFADYELKATSSYSDKNYSFPAKNLNSLLLFHPWVEGVPGYGVGEKVFFNSKEKEAIAGFYFSNGFVSFEKPYLYTQNARVKKIKVTNENKDFNFVYNIDDTPNLQYFEVKRNTQDLIIEILDVYPGTKWEDTAINFILLDTRDFVSYSLDTDNEK